MSVPDIFISYARADEPVARRFAETFTKEGFDVWWDDDLRSGEVFDEAIEIALRAARAVVVLWSPHSVSSRWVRAEATLADRNKTLIPAMIAPCDRPIIFELTHTAELCHWDGDTGDRGWKTFLKDVRGLVDRTKAREAEASSSADIETFSVPVDEGRPALAIMPFTNRSRQAEDDAFAEGMVEDLVAALSTNGELKVIASSSTRAYRDVGYDARQVGQVLGARYLLEGNVRHVGKDLRVTGQLVEAESGEILWTQKFDRPLEDLEMLQEDLVTEVAAHLGVQVHRIEVERALKKPGDLTAYQLTIRAGNNGLRQTPENIRRGLKEARKAVELAPSYALAHAQRALLAASHYWQLGGGEDDPAFQQETRDAARKAVRFEPTDSQILSIAAQSLCNVGFWEEGLRYAERAVEINPNLAASHAAMALVCCYYARAEELLQHLDAYDKLAPRSENMVIRMIQRAGAHFMLGDFEAALAGTQRVLMVDPGFIFAFKDTAINLEKLGRRAEAIEAVKELRELAPQFSIEDFARMHARSMLAPRVAQDFQDTLAAVWQAADEGAN